MVSFSDFFWIACSKVENFMPFLGNMKKLGQGFQYIFCLWLRWLWWLVWWWRSGWLVIVDG